VLTDYAVEHLLKVFNCCELVSGQNLEISYISRTLDYSTMM